MGNQNGNINPVVPSTPGSLPGQIANRTPSTKLPGATTIFRQAWEIYKNRFWVLLAITLLPAALVIGCIVFFAGGITAISLLAIQLGFTTSITGSSIIAGVVLVALVYLAILFLSFWAQTALVFAIKGAAEKIGSKNSFKQAFHKIASFFGASFLAGLAIVGTVILYVIIVTVLPLLQVPLPSYLSAILLLLCVVPAVFLGVRLSLSAFVVVGDNTKAWPAVKRSNDYVRGYWWPIFWRLLFIGIIAVVLSLGVTLFSAMLGVFFKGTSGMIGTIVGIIINIVVSAILPPLYTAYLYQTYSDLKKVKGESNAYPADKSGPVWYIAIAAVLIIVALFGSVFYASLNSGRSRSRDAQRLADVRQLASALELYFNDNNIYPSTLNELTVPPNHFTGQPNYINQIPTAPTPPDGSCSSAQNQYNYKLIDSSHYQLTFCLGEFTGGYPSGVETMTEQGIFNGTQTNFVNQNYTNPPTNSNTVENTITSPMPQSVNTQNNCAQISDPVNRYDCIINTGIQSKNISVCDTPPPQGNYGITDWKDGCLNAYAVQNNDPKVCDMLAATSRYKNSCVSYFSTKANNTQYK